MERQPLSIRKFGEVCGVSHTEIQRKMKDLAIEGEPQGKGLPTLLSPDEQDRIAQVLFIPAEAPSAPRQSVDVVGGGLDVYSPKPLSLRGSDGALSRHIQSIHLDHALAAFMSNQDSLDAALLDKAAEDGRQLGQLLHATKISHAMATHASLQERAGKQLGVVEESPADPSNA